MSDQDSGLTIGKLRKAVQILNDNEVGAIRYECSKCDYVGDMVALRPSGDLCWQCFKSHLETKS